MARDFPHIVDYARTQLDAFAQRDVCRVDSLVFSMLSYFRLPAGAPASDATTDDGVPLRELFRAEWFEPMCGKVYNTPESVALLTACAASPRFRDVRVCSYVTHTSELAEQQFSAMTFRISPEESFVAFRGTDNTIVGWKEDFNMSFATTVPSQVSAARYLERVDKQTSGRLWCGGHSKGGNLAVHAGVMASSPVRSRLVRLFSHDGPGFSAEAMAGERWRGAGELVDKTIPQSSTIGMIFERQEGDYQVVRSHASGFVQHDPFSWEVDGPDFAFEGKVGVGASALDSSVNEWLSTTSPEERERFVDTVFAVIDASGESTMAGIRERWSVTVPRMLACVAALQPEDRARVGDSLGAFVRTFGPSRP